MKRGVSVFFVFLVLWAFVQTSIADDQVGVVTICFDDAQKSVFSTAYPMFERYGLPATLYVISGGVENYQAFHMSWDQIRVVSKSGWEIGSHSHTHKDMSEIDFGEVEKELSLSRKILRDNGLVANSFATPFGGYNDGVVSLVKKYYTSHRGIERVGGELDLCLNELDVDQYEISAIQLHYDYQMKMIKAIVNSAAIEKKWVVFYLHGISIGNPEQKDYMFDMKKLDELLAYLKKVQDQGYIKVMTVSGFLETRESN